MVASLVLTARRGRMQARMRSAANDALTPLEDTRTLLEFRILGPLEAIDGDRVLTPVGAIQRALLAILLLNVNRVVSSDQLIDLLWDEQPPASGATALQVRVSQLRKALGKAGSVIVTRPPGYLIRLDGGQLDLHRFELLVDRANNDLAADDPASAAASLREALALWRGSPLADFTYALLRPARDRAPRRVAPGSTGEADRGGSGARAPRRPNR